MAINVKLQKGKGFTLMEVLLAGLILFITLSAMTLIYRGALFSSKKAQQVLVINSYVPIAVEQIEQLMQQPQHAEKSQISGQGKLLKTEFSFVATLNSAKSPLPRLSGFSNETIVLPARYKLWDVNLVLNLDGAEKSFQYQEITF